MCKVRRNSFAGAKLSDSYVYLNFDATDDWKMRESAQTAAERIIKVIEAHVNKVCQSFPRRNQIEIIHVLEFSP